MISFYNAIQTLIEPMQNRDNQEREKRNPRSIQVQRSLSSNLSRVSVPNLLNQPLSTEIYNHNPSSSSKKRQSSSNDQRATRAASSGYNLPSRPRNPTRKWTEEEDHKVRKWVSSHGACKWSLLSSKEFDGSRSGPQLRARYVDILWPGRNLGPWTAEADAALLALHQELGNQWHIIAQRLHSLRSATGNDVKNRYRLLIRSYEKVQKQQSHEDANVQ
uniref:Myb-like domain-containing protein n=1 Tax=Timspurckia oligopyrenoides TaxID=708627 RepID=A0A7S1ERR6_9RHOD|mmetsp:Transcript_2557/g.4497  ORF Transcript_2557/g.4497 Transcript_2557/m.4497 type:complete len:218 (+) Transcript_2557:266-919(+)